MEVRVRFYHPVGVFKGDRIVCGRCGAELDMDWLSDVVCPVFMRNRLEVGGYVFEVLVWNCEVKLFVYRDMGGGVRKQVEIEYSSEEILEKLKDLLLSSVEKAGGSLQENGFYPFSDELIEFLVECLKGGEIKVKSLFDMFCLR